MRILILSIKIPIPVRDGGAFAIKALIDGYNEAGHQVELLTMVTAKHQATTKLPEYYTTIDVDTRIKPVALIKNLLFSKMPYNAERFISEDFKNTLIQKLKSSDYDAVQLEGLYLAPYIPTIRNHSQSPIILRAHNAEYIIWQTLYRETKHLLKKSYFKLLAKRLKKLEIRTLNRVDGIMAITENDLQQFSQFTSTPAISIPTGISLSKEAKNILPEENTLFFIGSLDWIPNQQAIQWFIDKVWSKVYKQFPDVTLHIAGRGCPESLESSFQQPGIQYHGEVESATDFILSKKLMVLPLFAGSGLRIRLIEAMSYAKPIITTSTGAKGMPVTNNENILLADNETVFFNAIASMLKQPSKAELIGQNAKSFVIKNYNNGAISEKAINFIANLPSIK